MMVGQTIGPYLVLAKLGEGGMGEVYRARDTRLKREVALKVLPLDVAADPERLSRFQREAELLASLNHPHVAHLYGVEQADAATPHSRALVMELVEGPTLDERLSRGRLPLAETISIARQLAEALEYAHAHGVIHRDLKPANIKLATGEPGGDDAPSVKVLDFGLAKALEGRLAGSDQINSPTLTTPAMTAAGVLMGTAGYMSPEQARGLTVDKRADIWAFGVVLYEMLTGRRLFEGETVSDSIAAVLRADPNWAELPSNTPQGLRRLVSKCLERDRKRRLQDIGDARVELEDLATQESFSEKESAPPAPLVTRSSRALWVMVGVLSLACMVMAWITFGRRTDATASVNPATHWRFSMPSPRFIFGGRTIAISPDGMTLAYVANVPTGGRAVYVRKIGEIESKVLAGTDLATELFFSPDSQWIGFSAGSLKKVPVTGGLPVVITDTMNGSGGSVWAPDGSIYFSAIAGVPDVGLWKVPSSGGTPVQIARPLADASLYHPELTPDGQTILATSAHRNGARDIVAIRLQTGERKTVVEGAGDPRLTGNGYLLVGQPGRIMATRWDDASATASGGLVPFLEGVATDIRLRATMSFAPNGALVFVPGGATGALQGHLAIVDTAGTRTIVRGEPRGYWDPTVSPDGQRVAFDRRNEDIYVVHLGSGAATRLSFSNEEDETPVWSPDGTRVAYSSSRGAERLIFVKNADGSGSEEKVFAAPVEVHIHVRDWSEDGKTVIYDVRQRVGAAFDIHALDLATNTTRPIATAPGDQQQARLSRDGRWMAYTSNESGRNEVYVLAFPNGDGRWQISTNGGVQPEWSRDGRRLYFRAGGRIHVADITPGARFTVASPQPLAFDDRGWDPNSGGHAHWTLAGDRFLFFEGAEQSLSSEIHVVLGWRSLLPNPTR